MIRATTLFLKSLQLAAIKQLKRSKRLEQDWFEALVRNERCAAIDPETLLKIA